MFRWSYINLFSLKCEINDLTVWSVNEQSSSFHHRLKKNKNTNILAQLCFFKLLNRKKAHQKSITYEKICTYMYIDKIKCLQNPLV